jgi:DNA-binding response OmpR family regulator
LSTFGKNSKAHDWSDWLCVLLLEDDRVLRDRILAPKLRKFGFQVDVAGSTAELNQITRKRSSHIYVLDVGLPDGNGFDVAKDLRARQADAGIIMLTGHSDRSAVVRGLTESADAYLPKPVEIDVLVATLYSVARRLGLSRESTVGTWHLSADGWFLHSPRGRKARLSKAEKLLIETLISTPGDVVLRESLIRALSEGTDSFDSRRLDALVHRLRRKVSMEAGEPLPLDVVHGTGYLFAI